MGDEHVMKNNQALGNTVRKVFKERSGTIFWSAVLLVLAATLALLAWQHSNRRVSTDYEGRVVDRWGDYSESQQGSRPRLRLLIETDDGKRFIVKVDPSVYESAKVGMRIKSRSGQVVLTETGQTKTVGK